MIRTGLVSARSKAVLRRRRRPPARIVDNIALFRATMQVLTDLASQMRLLLRLLRRVLSGMLKIDTLARRLDRLDQHILKSIEHGRCVSTCLYAGDDAVARLVLGQPDNKYDRDGSCICPTLGPPCENGIAFWHHRPVQRWLVFDLGMIQIKTFIKIGQLNPFQLSTIDAIIDTMLDIRQEVWCASSGFAWYLDSRARSGPFWDSPPIPINLLDEAVEAIRGSCRTARAHQIEVVCDEAALAALPNVAIRHSRGSSVLPNLLWNAIRYGTRSSIIFIHAARSADGALCGYVVESRGFGIPTSELSRLLEIGYRGAHAAEIIPGAGLGLFLVKEEVDLSGGRIQIECGHLDGRDIATRVTVLFPVFLGSERIG